MMRLELDMKKCPICSRELSFPEAVVPEGQYHTDHISAAKEQYGVCDEHGIAHPGLSGHNGSLDLWGNWTCYNVCRKCGRK